MMKKLISGLLVLSALAIQAPAVCAQPADSENARFNQGTDQQQRIDLNSATVEQLITLPGVGQSKAKAIIKYREEVGPFLEVAQLTQVKGIGEKMLNKIESYVQVR
jgi:competence protein ComEA